MSYNFTYTTNPPLIGTSLAKTYGVSNGTITPQGSTGNVQNVLYTFPGTIPLGTYTFSMTGVLKAKDIGITSYYYATTSLNGTLYGTITTNCSQNASNPVGGGSGTTLLNINMGCTFTNSNSDTYTVYFQPLQNSSYGWPVIYYGSMEITRIG